MKRVTIYTIAAKEQALAGDWIKLYEMKGAPPQVPWNAPDSGTGVIVEREVKVARVRRAGQDDCYVAIDEPLAELLKTALLPAMQLDVDLAKSACKRAADRAAGAHHREVGLEVALSNAQCALKQLSEKIFDFESLPWHKRLWRAWKGRL